MRESRLPRQAYSEKILEHTGNTRNAGSLDGGDPRVGTGVAGTPASVDMVRIQVKVNERQLIEDVRFKAFGCGSSVASSGLMTEWIKSNTGTSDRPRPRGSEATPLE